LVAISSSKKRNEIQYVYKTAVVSTRSPLIVIVRRRQEDDTHQDDKEDDVI
jgi:hypothetical protein